MRNLHLLLALLALPAAAQQPMIYTHLSTGTGFLVNDSGDVVTNAHVVQNCQSISMLTPRGEEMAELVVANQKQDLALLKTAYFSRDVARFRQNVESLKPGDPAVIVGYPGEKGFKGQYSFKKTYIADLSPHGTRWIDKDLEGRQLMNLASVADHGNSGGPVLDSASHVIGVISGMALTYRVDKDGKVAERISGQNDVAITLPALQDFLRSSSVRWSESTSDNDVLSDGTIRNRALKFTFPVRCVLSKETR